MLTPCCKLSSSSKLNNNGSFYNFQPAHDDNLVKDVDYFEDSYDGKQAVFEFLYGSYLKDYEKWKTTKKNPISRNKPQKSSDNSIRIWDSQVFFDAKPFLLQPTKLNSLSNEEDGLKKYFSTVKKENISFLTIIDLNPENDCLVLLPIRPEITNNNQNDDD